MSKNSVRISTKQPGIYKNMVTGKYDVKYCYSEVDPLTNEKKHRQKWYYSINSYKEAKDLLACKKNTSERKTCEKFTLQQAKELWNEKAKANRYSLISVRNTDQQFNMITKFWSPNLAIEDITESHYLRLIDSCREYGYSEETIWNINSCVRKIIKLAYRNRCISENPLDFWDSPRINTGARKNVITQEEFLLLDQFFSNNEFRRLGRNNYPKYRLLLNLLYYTGMRIGEVIALTYSDFIYSDKSGKKILRVSVNKSYNSAYRLLKDTKNHKDRIIPLPKCVEDIFIEICRDHLLHGGNDNDRIITWNHSACRMMIEKACKTTGLRTYCCHDFRHTYISNLIRLNVPLPIIEYVSGDTQETILKHYSHMFNGDELLLLDALESM